MATLTINNAYCGELAQIYYGLLYNWYAVDTATTGTSIAATGWKVPENTDYEVLVDYLGAAGDYATNTIGGKLKSISTVLWESPNSGATDEVGFHASGTGYRTDLSATFALLLKDTYIWAATGTISTAYILRLRYDNENAVCNSRVDKNYGGAVRLLKESTTLVHGETGIYTGNDGAKYATICIGTQEWLANELIETRFRNGDIIPYHGLDNNSNFTNAEWEALTTAGVCAYNNDLANVAAGFSFPT